MLASHQLGSVRRALSAAIAALLVLSTTAWAAHDGSGAAGTLTAEGNDPSLPGATGHEAALAVADLITTTTTTTAPPPPPTTAPPPPTTARPRPAPQPKPPTTAAAAGPLRAARLNPPAVPVGLTPYVGMGTWVDVYDWTNTYTNGKPATTVADVDRMADLGVQTLYIQASKHDAPQDLADPELLLPLLRRAKERNLRVVAWYLPTLVDPQRDLDRMLAIARLPDVDSVAVDIEARNVSDVNDRNRRLVQYSQALRQALPGRTIGAIVLPPVVLEVVNPNYWPNFPYKEIAPFYDVWQTMGYWTNRKADSGYRDAYRYTKENVDRLRNNVGKADLPVHPIGGLGEATSANDVEHFRQAAVDTRSIGGSLYDWRTTKGDCWPGMGGFRA
jgi:hypothetical protein